MDFDTLAPLFFDPAQADVRVPPLPDTAARRLRDALEPIATQGWWSRAVSPVCAPARAHAQFARQCRARGESLPTVCTQVKTGAS